MKSNELFQESLRDTDSEYDYLKERARIENMLVDNRHYRGEEAGDVARENSQAHNSNQFQGWGQDFSRSRDDEE